MEDEKFLSGYCRALDQTRMVTVEITDDDVVPDCSFGSCPYEGSCQIAKSIRELSQN